MNFQSLKQKEYFLCLFLKKEIICFSLYLGAVFSGISCVEVFASLIGAAVFNPIYSKTNTFMHGFVYLAISVCQFLAVVLVL